MDLFSLSLIWSGVIVNNEDDGIEIMNYRTILEEIYVGSFSL